MERHNDGPSCGLCVYKLKDAHPLLQAWFNKRKTQFLNLHISESFRGEAQQNRDFIEGKSKKKFPDSKHNKTPAEALDVFLIDEDGIARFPNSFYSMLDKKNVEDKDPIAWGGNWKTFKDGPHFELV